MRALLDTNIFISYLLKPHLESAIQRIITSAVLGHFTLLLPEAVLEEFQAKARTKPYLSDRISLEAVSELVTDLVQCGEAIPRITEQIPAVTCDPKDDYLLAYALVGQADYLVTGDDDLLSLEVVENLKILTPAAFAQFLLR